MDSLLSKSVDIHVPILSLKPTNQPTKKNLHQKPSKKPKKLNHEQQTNPA